MKCNNCGAEAPENSAFCPKCGQAMVPASPEAEGGGRSPAAQKTDPPAPPYPPQGYYPPALPQVIVTANQQKPTNGLAVAGFVCSLAALFLPFTIFLSFLGLIFGAIGLSKAKSLGAGKGLAIAGIILSIPSLALGVTIILLWSGLLAFGTANATLATATATLIFI